MKISVAGIGYVDFSETISLSQHSGVVAIEIVPKKGVMFNHKRSPIVAENDKSRGMIPLEVIEVQIGECPEEENIECFEDDIWWKCNL